MNEWMDKIKFIKNKEPVEMISIKKKMKLSKMDLWNNPW